MAYISPNQQCQLPKYSINSAESNQQQKITKWPPFSHPPQHSCTKNYMYALCMQNYTVIEIRVTQENKVNDNSATVIPHRCNMSDADFLAVQTGQHR